MDSIVTNSDRLNMYCWKNFFSTFWGAEGVGVEAIEEILIEIRKKTTA